MKKTTIYFACLLTTIWGMTSCVPQSRFAESQQLNDHYRMELDSLRGLDRNPDGEIPSEYSYGELETKQSSIEMDLTVLQESYDNLKTYNNDILRRYDELLAQNKELLNASSSDVQSMTGRLSQTEATADQQAREIQRLKNQILSLQNEMASAEKVVAYTPPPAPAAPVTIVTNDCSDYERQVQNLNNLLAQKENRLRQLRSNVNQALLGFSDADLSVSERNGKIYVSLSQNLLFASNSTSIDWKGKKAIRSLAAVLNQNQDINIIVEGHTDSDGSPQKNWDLSVGRATSVAKVLADARVDPKRITASGRSFYYPVAPNTTAAGKAKNRRTEIILSPQLDQLYRIINE